MCSMSGSSALTEQVPPGAVPDEARAEVVDHLRLSASSCEACKE